MVVPGDLDVDAIAESMEHRVIRGGETLMAKGDPADGLYLVVRGRMVLLDDRGRPTTFFGRDEFLGEIGLIGSQPRTATVIAARDSEVLWLGRKEFERLFATKPDLARHLATVVVTRLIAEPEPIETGRIPSTVAVLALHPDQAETARRVSDALTAVVPFGTTFERRGLEHRRDTELREAFDAAESAHDLVVLDAGVWGEADADEWIDRCLRSADSVVVVAGRRRRRSAGLERLAAALRRSLAVGELVFEHDAGSSLGVVGDPRSRWLPHDRWHHVRERNEDDAARVARLVSGRATGLVLSGGSARGLAHIGAWRALRELDVPIDAVAGSSFGAIVGFGIASDLDPDTLHAELSSRLSPERAIADFTLPILSLLRGREVTERLEAFAGGAELEQLWRSLVCTSCDLTSGSLVEHRTGSAWEAVRASMSMPGIFPPWRDGDRVLVDGGLLDNVPVGPLRRSHPVPIRTVAIDVSRHGALDPELLPEGGSVSGWSLLARRLQPWRRSDDVASLAQVLMRIVDFAGLESGPEPDLLVRPDVRSSGSSDFGAIDEMADAGYGATMEQLPSQLAEFGD